MIILKNINEEITSFNNIPIMGIDGNPLTFKGALITFCELYKAPSNGDGTQLKAFSIGSKILDAKEEVSVSKDDIAFLKKIVTDSNNFIAVVTGKLLQYLDLSEDKEEK